MTKQEYSHSLYRPDVHQILRWKQCSVQEFIRDQDYLSIDKIIDKIIDVPTMSWDFWARSNNILDVDFIKLDTQGAELEILMRERSC